VYSYSRPSVTLWHQGTSPSANFTTFGVNGATTVRVSKIGTFITSADVSPHKSQIPVQISNGQALLTLSQGTKAWIILNGDDGDPLFIFADNLKPAIPKQATYFGPGVHDLSPSNGHHYVASNNEVIYLDGGAWVRGNIVVQGKSNVQIMGPGVLSGDVWTSEAVQSLPFNQTVGYAMVSGDWGGKNATVQNITVVDSPAYNFYGGIHSVTGVKLLSPWYYSTDGFQGVNHVDQVFAFVGDNVFFPIWAGIGNDGVTVTNSFAGNSNNAVFCGGYWGNPATDGYTALVKNIDIKTYNSDAWVPFGVPLTPALVQIWVDNNDSTRGYSNQAYEDIRVEGSINTSLVMLKNMAYPWGGGASTFSVPLGSSSNITFANISLSGTQKVLSEIKGYDTNNGFHNVLFQNLSIDGAIVTPSNYGAYFEVNNYVSGLSFQ
jgi:hypothetical protein